MSAFELPLEHLQVLIAAGQRAGISRVVQPNGLITSFDLETLEGRAQLLAALRSENRSALGRSTPIREDFFRVGNLEDRWPNPRIDSPRDAAQLIAWVRNFEYQSAGSPTWLGSIAQVFCSALTGHLLDRMIQMFRLSWSFASEPVLLSLPIPDKRS